MAEGWIMLHRKLTEHWVWQKKPFSYGQAWADILLECNHDERKTVIKGTLVTCQRGQSINSLKTWAKRWGWTIAATRHFLTLLENDKMIDTKSERVTTRLSVCKYETYQSKQHAEQSQNNRKAIAKQSQSNTNNNVNNENNEKNKSNGLAPLPVALLKFEGMRDAWEDWVKHRQEINKRITPTSQKMQFAKLIASKDPVGMIRHSIANGWQGLFEPAKKNGQSNGATYARYTPNEHDQTN